MCILLPALFISDKWGLLVGTFECADGKQPVKQYGNQYDYTYP